MQIVGSTVNVPVSIEASVATLDVSLTAASVTVNESIVGQTVAVYSGSQYAPVQGNGLYINGSASIAEATFTDTAYYTVPAGKTLYLQGAAYGMEASAAQFSVIAQLQVAAITQLVFGSFVGDSLILDSPLIVAAGVNVRLQVAFFGPSATQTVLGSLWGWLG